ncbi:MAG TPA: DUF488 domain-containing protein [Syntrophorhabdaceae bacterium]|nr:DUF488 domain-containing protein [Syntrophorhabdaceae bacterium]
MEIYTIGFTKKKAMEFFEVLKKAGIRRIVDIRLNNISQLTGFTKRDDLRYFLKEICKADYVHLPILAPDTDIMDAYKKKRIGWDEYEKRFMRLLRERRVEKQVERAVFDLPSALLCSEPGPEHCHRRLAAEYLSSKWGGVNIIHL